MRKIVNTFFVMLAMTSVTYGMILRYSHEPAVVSAVPDTLSPQYVDLPEFDPAYTDESALDLDMISAEPD